MQTKEYGKITFLDILGLLIISIGASIMSLGMKFVTNETIQVSLYEKIKAKFDEQVSFG